MLTMLAWEGSNRMMQDKSAKLADEQDSEDIEGGEEEDCWG